MRIDLQQLRCFQIWVRRWFAGSIIAVRNNMIESALYPMPIQMMGGTLSKRRCRNRSRNIPLIQFVQQFNNTGFDCKPIFGHQLKVPEPGRSKRVDRKPSAVMLQQLCFNDGPRTSEHLAMKMVCRNVATIACRCKQRVSIQNLCIEKEAIHIEDDGRWKSWKAHGSAKARVSNKGSIPSAPISSAKASLRFTTFDIVCDVGAAVTFRKGIANVAFPIRAQASLSAGAGMRRR